MFVVDQIGKILWLNSQRNRSVESFHFRIIILKLFSMSLFPAYAQDDVEETSMDYQAREVSPAREAQLLESEEEPTASPPASPAPSRSPLSRRDNFYLDFKSDYGNLRVSTLYFPGRPQYARGEVTLGRKATAAAVRRGRKRRYFEQTDVEPLRDGDELSARVAAFRRMLADAPQDADLWLRFIRFQEQCNGTGAALEVAVEAVSRAPNSRALHVAHHRLARRHLPADTYLSLLRDHIANEKSIAAQSELWVRLVEALASSPAACSAHALAAAARAAATRVALHPPAYPHLIVAYGSFLRAAGLWELLVLLVELVASMSFPPTAVFPPAEDEARAADCESRLLQLEDEMGVCGLPLGARWVRVERARAAAHWRAPRAAPAADLRADPQRAPLPADLADLLLPVAGADEAFVLAAQLLRLAKVPMLPAGGHVRRAFAPGALEAADACAEALLPLLRAARRLPAAHTARPRAATARRLLALLVDPPHYCSDDAGFLSWVTALWEACCAWVSGERRVALLCWRLRWLQALAALCDSEDENGRAELKRIRSSARGALRTHAGASPLPFAQFARLELLVGGPAAAAVAARHAARAALRDNDLPPEQRLYVARVASEMGPESGGTWATVCAALGRPLPGDEELRAPPPPALRDAALDALEERCAALEDELDVAPDDVDEKPGERLAAALAPGAGEWAAARALLATPRRRHQLFLSAAAHPPRADASWRAARYHEQAACALAAAARAHHSLAPYARRLAPHFPHNAFLALAGGGSWAGSAAGAEDADARRQTECGALADLLPPLLRAVDAWGAGAAAAGAAAAGAAGATGRAAARAARRAAAAGGGGALAWAALLEAAARAPEPGLAPQRALLHATDAHPAHKWLYVRGAAWCGAEGAALADVLLERQLRLHALPDELAAAADVAAECRRPPSPPAADARPALGSVSPH